MKALRHWARHNVAGLLLTGAFVILAIFMRPPTFEELNQDEARISHVQELHRQTRFVFEIDHENSLECVHQHGSRLRECPSNELKDLWEKRATLKIWHLDRKVYQIEAEGERLVKYESWTHESQYVVWLAVAMILSMIVATPFQRKHEAKLRREAKARFRIVRLDSSEPSLVFRGATAQIIKDEEFWYGGVVSGFSQLDFTRFARNEHGEYFLFKTDTGKTGSCYITHLRCEDAMRALGVEVAVRSER